MTVRTRFAPSPTGHVHIGNIRVAIFNWLFARHEQGAFLLRIEDTDIERSTPEAIATLLEALKWLGLDADESPMYQTSQNKEHLEAAAKLLEDGAAYKSAKGGSGEATLFRIPWDAEKVDNVSTVGEARITVHPEVPVVVSSEGFNFANVSKKGKPVPAAACLAGFRDLRILDSSGTELFTLNDKIKAILTDNNVFEIENAAEFVFTRRQVEYQDLVKGTLAKPLDSMRDFVIVRSDGTPVFHLANVCDDITQKITHIIRGDDHVENTYRHLFLFAALGAQAPHYAHLPMIVNSAGKPYSKRDGDAFVGDFREKGYLPQALFNYLSLLGWSPGDDREKMTREEMIEAFGLDRVQSSAAQMDIRKLDNLNSLYIAEMPPTEFIEKCWQKVQELDWSAKVDKDYFARVAELLQSRAKKFQQVEEWRYFFTEPEYDEAATRKLLKGNEIRLALSEFKNKLQQSEDITPETVERLIHEATDAVNLKRGQLNQPLRLTVTGTKIGAGIYETIELLGYDRTVRRIEFALEHFASNSGSGD